MNKFMTLNKATELREVLQFLLPLKNDYPGFGDWYNRTIYSGVRSGQRKVIASIDAERDCISGIAILKDMTEKKICTLYVGENYRGRKVGRELMTLSILKLHDSHPLITVSSSHLLEYKKLLDDFGFSMGKDYPNYYKDGITEFSFNGFILNQRECKMA